LTTQAYGLKFVGQVKLVIVMVLKFFISGFLLVISFYGFSQKQGICGKVLWVEGNQMPGTSKRTPPQGVIREIYVHQVTTLKQTSRADGFFVNISTPLIGKTTSRADGSYEINLPPGKYSVFIKEQHGFFANIFDQDVAINPVTVEVNEMISLTISINYKAAF
jgi:hypothetical protein